MEFLSQRSPNKKPRRSGVLCNVEVGCGGRLMAEFTDIDPDAIEVGQTMRMMFRIKGIDERGGFRRYFWKAAPAF